MSTEELMDSKIDFSRIDNSGRWKDIFDTIDNNFYLVKLYLENIGNRVKMETFIAREDQTEFTLSDQYNTKRNCLSVYRGGARQWIGEGFKESSNNKFELYEPCIEGEKIVAIYNKNYLLLDYSLENNSNYIDLLLKVDSDSSRSEYKITLNHKIDSYVDGMSLIIVPNVNCNENPRININNSGDFPLVDKEGETLWEGDLKANIPYRIIKLDNKFFVQ